MPKESQHVHNHRERRASFLDAEAKKANERKYLACKARKAEYFALFRFVSHFALNFVILRLLVPLP
jgi:hypothetical protein